MDFTKTAYGLDGYEAHPNIDFELLKPYIDFYVFRLGTGGKVWGHEQDPASAVDKTFHAQVQGAWNTGKICGAYYVPDPLLPIDPKWTPQDPASDRQIAPIYVALRGLAGKSVQFIAVDVEIWMDYRYQVITNNQISSSAKTLISRLLKLYPTMPIGLYTNDNFIQEHAPDMYVWIEQFRREYGARFFTWEGAYPRDTRDPLEMSELKWEELRTKHDPAWPKTKSFPWMGNAENQIWQYSGKTHYGPGWCGEVKGKMAALDISVFNGSVEQMKAWCGYKDHGVTPPITPPVVPPVVPPTPTTDWETRFKTLESRVYNHEGRINKIEGELFPPSTNK